MIIKMIFKIKQIDALISSILIIFFIISFVNCHQNHHQNQQQQVFQQQQHNQQHNQAHTNEHNSMMDNINRDHVLEHLDGVINKPKDQMTVDEQNFYYFKLHDYDNNNMLDGLELVSAFAHNNEEHLGQEQQQHDDHANGNGNGNNNSSKQAQHIARISDDELIKLIDGIMADEDKNLDGYITYQEFLHAIKA